jgi:NADPH-dependent glutamate synthase beta subunit-like oxidoreductase
MMRFGIPKYRLPREVLDAEVKRITEMGVHDLLQQKRVSDVWTRACKASFDAVFLAVGAHIAKRTHIPAGDSAQVLDAVQLLRGIESGRAAAAGAARLVYGGGNTAMDVARSARRLGATDAIVVYRRTREKMPAHDFEVQEAMDEGVMFKWLSTIKAEAKGRSRSRR